MKTSQVGKKWRKVSIDAERKIEKLDTHTEFVNIISEVMDGSPNTKKRYKEMNKHPIRSYGIILVFEDENTFHYMIGEMRTTIEFAELIRSGPDPEKIYDYLCLMTKCERKLLRTYSHSKLWDDLLMGLKGFEKRKEFIGKKFNKFKKVMPKLIDLTKTRTDTLPFGFPKGRTKQGDITGLASAVRELKEEAKIDLGKIVLMLDDPVEEIYSGTDNTIYTTIYYIIKADKMYEPQMTYLNTNVVSEMVLSEDFKNYIWFPISKNANNLEKIRTPLNERREKMLLQVHKMLTQ